MYIFVVNIDWVYFFVILWFFEMYLVFIDWFLVVVELFCIFVILFYNKIDLFVEVDLKEVECQMEFYIWIGYLCYVIFVKLEENIVFLWEEICGYQVMIFGYFGIGKSMLVNVFDLLFDLWVGEIFSVYYQGQYIIIFVEMYLLELGGFIIDIFGIWVFGIVDLEKEVIFYYFFEMWELLGECCFYNCQYLNELGCVVKEVVVEGIIVELCFCSYWQMLIVDDENVYCRNKYI